MTEKQEKLSEKLSKIRKNIEDTKRLIAYHKKMLKIYIRKESEISDKLEKEQLNDLFKIVKDKGCDIEAINTAINNGEFSVNGCLERSIDTSTSGRNDNENLEFENTEYSQNKAEFHNIDN